MVDLHQHTTLSDGTDSVQELVEKNSIADIKYMSITDHDNIDSVKMVLSLENKYNIKYVSGVEFSTENQGDSIHILCYGYKPDDPILLNLVNQGIIFRHKRVADRLDILENEFNVKLPAEVINNINNNSNPNKVLIANVLKDLGYGNNIGEIIKKYLYHKMPNYKLNSVETVQSLSKSTGICVYAHPLGGVGEKRVPKEVFEQRLQDFVNAGLKGLECYYSLYTKEEQEYLVKMAKKHCLLITGGSDYHGLNKNVKIGELSSFNENPNLNDLTILNELEFLNI